MIDAVRFYIYQQTAETARVPRMREIAEAFGKPEDDIRAAVRELAKGRALIMAPNDGEIWAPEPFCGTPSAFRVDARGRSYWALCIWDALGVIAVLGGDGLVHTTCGDCGEPMQLHVRDGALAASDALAHFAVPALRFWDNIAFT